MGKDLNRVMGWYPSVYCSLCQYTDKFILNYDPILLIKRIIHFLGDIYPFNHIVKDWAF